jgi:alkylated DNA repair dioxygenase AlkB
MVVVKDPSSPGMLETLKENRVIALSNFFCDEADLSYYNTLRLQLQWQQHEVSPHLTAAASLQNELVRQVLAKVDTTFEVTSVRGAAVNYYTSGNETKNFHRDSHATSQTTGIAAFIGSFGGPRQLDFRPYSAGGFCGSPVSFTLRNGMLLVLCPQVNREWVHGIPQSLNNEGRISITRDSILCSAAQLWAAPAVVAARLPQQRLLCRRAAHGSAANCRRNKASENERGMLRPSPNWFTVR